MDPITHPDHKQLDLPQGGIRYRDLGEGEPIVFVHGLLVNGRLWDGVAEALSGKGFRCIVPDWPMGSHSIPMSAEADLSGYGMARLVADLIEALELGPVTLVGNDSGGAISQIVATEHPEVVGRLVLTNCDAFDNFPPKLFSYLIWGAKVPGALTALAQPLRLKPLRRSPVAFGLLTKKRVDDEILEDWVRPGLDSGEIRRDTRKFINGISPKQTQKAAEKLPGLRAPALLAWAHEDRWFPVEHAERLAEIIPDARVERIDDAKTFVPLDQPERVAELIDGFVREKAKATAAA